MESESIADGRRREVVLAGFVVALIGTAALVSELYPEVDRYLPLVIGVGLLGAFVVGRWYAALVGGAILGGLGIGLVATRLIGDVSLDGAGALLGLASGFLTIWIVSVLMSLAQRHWWPLVPGSVLLIVGLYVLAEAAGAALAAWLVPAAVLALGVVIMAVGYVVTGRHVDYPSTRTE
jgi:hypothetical protein